MCWVIHENNFSENLLTNDQKQNKNRKKSTATTQHYYGKSDSLSQIIVLNTFRLATRSVYAQDIGHW